MTGFKKILSYLIDFPIERRNSQYSGEVIVSYHRGQYKLSTQNAIYSYGKYYTSFSIPFESLDIQTQKIESVLVLGFGLGSVIDLLAAHPFVRKITAVDADEVIIGLAGKYLQAPLKDVIEYVADDAERFTLNQQQKFDLVLFDVFIDNQTPMPFMRNAYLTALKNLVASDGFLLFSKIDDSHRNHIENAQFEQIFSAVFPGAFSINASGNKVFVWINK